MLFRLNNVAKAFHGQCIFQAVTVQCNPREVIGLIGANGCGKTTLLNLIEGRIEADEGQVHRAGIVEISRIEQSPRFTAQTSLRDEALQVFNHFKQMQERLGQLEAEMTRFRKVSEATAREYQSLQLKVQLQGGFDYTARTEAVLMGLGFSRQDFDRPCSHLSGGQQSRLLLAQGLLRQADLLLLDEPTNHLDIQGIGWLSDYLRKQGASVILVSHDRRFLDAVCSRIWEIENSKLYDYPGNFTRARHLRVERFRRQMKQYQIQQKWREEREDFIRRNIAGQKTRQARARRKQLKKTKWVDKPTESGTSLRLGAPRVLRGGACTLAIEQGCIGYPGNVLIRDVNLRLSRGNRIGLLGDNGSGKTTLLRSLLGEIPLLEGRMQWGPDNVPGYFSQTFSLGKSTDTVYHLLRELDLNCTDGELRSFAAQFLFRKKDVDKRVEDLSGGERSRLALARLLFHPSSVLILDEPTNHLDIPSCESVEEVLLRYNGTLVVVSHDLYFLKRVLNQFYLIRRKKLIPVENLDQLSFEEEKLGVKKRREARRSLQSLNKLSKNERLRSQQKLWELEVHIEDLEASRQKVLTKLQEPDRKFSRLHELSRQHDQFQARMDELYSRWEREAKKLDKAGAL